MVGKAEASQLTWSTSTNTLSVVALLEETMYTADWELEASLGRTRARLFAGACGLAGLGFAADFTGHGGVVVWCGGMV